MGPSPRRESTLPGTVPQQKSKMSKEKKLVGSVEPSGRRENSSWLLRSPRNASGLRRQWTGLLTCARFSHLPNSGPHGSPSVVLRSSPNWKKRPLLKPCLNDLSSGHEALTVAGQWRTFTAFPSILAITVLVEL